MVSAALLASLSSIQGNHRGQRAVERHRSIQIQRSPDSRGIANEAIGAVQLDGGKRVMFYKLDRNHALFHAGRLNGGALMVMKLVLDLTKREGAWRKELMVVSKHYGSGPARLEIVKQAAETIGDRTKGQRGKYTRDAIEGYDAAIKQANDAFLDLVDKQKGIDEAISRMHTLALKAKQAEQEAAVKDAESAVAGEKARIEEERKYLKKLLDISMVVVNPTEWVGTAVDAATFVGGEAIDKLYTTDHLGELEAKLREAQQALKQIQNDVHLSEVATAKIVLDRAQSALVRAKARFHEATDSLRLKETTMVEALGSSRATRGAAAAIAERGKVSQAALNAADQLAEYVRRTEASYAFAGVLFDRYYRVIQAADHIADVDGPDKDHALKLASFSNMNRDGLMEIGQWLEKKRNEAQASSSLLATGRFFEGYADIPQALSDAVKHRNGKALTRTR